MDPQIRTKLGQAPSDSPRTLDSNRRRLGSLFSTLIIGESSRTAHIDDRTEESQQREVHGTPSKPSARKGGWLEWLSPAKLVQSGDTAREDDCDDGEEHEEKNNSSGLYTRRSSSADAGEQERYAEVEQLSALYRLPDEVLTQILLHLPPSLQQIIALRLVSRRFATLSQSPQLWLQLLDHTPGFDLLPEFRERIVATPRPPNGRWNQDEWVASSIPTLPHMSEDIPVHLPTLYRSRRALHRVVHCQTLSGPPHRVTLRDHADSIYCVHVSAPWLVTGSRDRSIRFWRLDDLRLGGNDAPQRETRLVKTVAGAHTGSVLSVRLELNAAGTGGWLVTGSSDMTAGVWKVELGDEETVERVETLRGHTGGVLDVVLSTQRIVTASKDSTIRIYDRADFAHLYTLDAHTGPVNCLSMRSPSASVAEEVVSASGDGHWIMWDVLGGTEIRRGGGEGRGFACVIWVSDRIITGDNDRLVKLFSATESTLLKTFEGHSDLVRSVAVDPTYGVLVSGSYDQTVRMWDLETGVMIRRIRGNHTSLVFGVAAARGRVISVSHDSTVQILTYGHGLPYRGLFA